MPERVVPQALTAWASVADSLTWTAPWTSLYEADPPFGRWFVGGQLNFAVNCVDRHVDAGHGSRPAVLWEGEPGDRRILTYDQLASEVRTLAGALRGLGVGVGDRVALHLGWVPEIVVAMLACARIGAVYTVLPTPLPVEALAERLADFGPRVLFTQDGAWRHGTIIPLKSRVDDALTAVSGVEHTVVVRRTGIDVAWYEGDRWLDELVAARRPGQPLLDGSAPSLPADQIVTSVPLANRRGQPVSVLHGAARMLASVVAVHRHGLSTGGVFWCASEISWIGAQAHGVFGPLACGDTAVMYEGMLDVPTRSRAWEIVHRYGVRTLVTTPSVTRHLRGWSRRPPSPATTASLRRIVMIGEPVDSSLAEWLVSKVGRGSLSLGDAWGQIETTGIAALLDNPVDPSRLPSPGLAILSDDGLEVAPGTAGELVMRQPWAGLMLAMEGVGAGDILSRHWRLGPEVYCTEDNVRTRPDGRLEFLGRRDEVTNVSGQLVSMGEVRSVLLEHPFVLDAEVVQKADRSLGRSLAAAVVPAASVSDDAVLARGLLDTVQELLGGLARPRALLIVDRFGSELAAPARRRALALLAASVEDVPVRVTWEQVVAAHREL